MLGRLLSNGKNVIFGMTLAADSRIEVEFALKLVIKRNSTF